MNVSLSVPIQKPASEVASVLCDFARLADWYPGVERCDVEGAGEGAVRSYVIAGKVYRDRLVNEAQDGLGYFYEQLEGPLPVASLKAFVAVSADTEQSCKVAWSADVEPGAMPPAAVESALTQMTLAGLKVLTVRLELGELWPDDSASA